MSLTRFGLAACALFIGVKAIDTITVPDVITADTPFTLTVTPKDDTSGNYRIYLDTTPPGYAGGQSCMASNTLNPQRPRQQTNKRQTGYLKNSTSTDITAVNLTIPANFGPSGSFYSISTRDLSDPDADASYVFSNAFNLTGATGNYSDYENELNGAPLWDANALPCTAYDCARTCAQDSYPQDLEAGSNAAATMRKCILACPGVQEETTTTTSSSSASSTATGSGSKTGSSGSASSASATGTSSSGDSASSTSGSAAASSSQTGAAALNAAPVSFAAAAAAGLVFFL